MSLSLSKPYHPFNQAQVFTCIICEDPITTESSQRGLPRKKCDYCIKEKDRLVNTMRYWMKKVGVYFELDGDWN